MIKSIMYILVGHTDMFCAYRKCNMLRQKVRWLVDFRGSENWKELLAPDVLLSDANRERFIARLKKMKPLGFNSKAPVKKAAVFVPLCVVRNQVSLLYTLRAADLSSYRGHVSFPGGVKDQSDKTLQQTAIRETCEELGVDEDKIDIWGHGAFVATRYKDMAVMPFVGFLGNLDVQDLNFNPQEVESTFTVPLQVFCDPHNCRFTQFRSGYVLPVFIGGQHRIWGLTALITYSILQALLPQKLYRHKLRFIKQICSTDSNNSSSTL